MNRKIDRSWTTIDEPKEVRSLLRINEVLHWQVDPEQQAVSVAELNDCISKLRQVPVDLRRFLGAIAARMHRMLDIRVVYSSHSCTSILVSDIKGAFQLSDKSIAERANQLASYGVAGIDQIDTDLGAKPAVKIWNLPSGWPLWIDIAEFCEITSEPMKAFTEQLDFSRLDG